MFSKQRLGFITALALAIIAGALTVFRAEALPPVIDLNVTPAGLTVHGNTGFDFTGWAVASGDIDGDGIDDVIIGAPLADSPGGGNAGKTYVIYGGSPPPAVDLASSAADLTILGDDIGDRSGTTVAAGDINGDNIDDVIIGAPEADNTGGNDAGETYVIYGGPALPASIDLGSTPADLTVYGNDFFDESGSALAAGDITGDSYDELIIGASEAARPSFFNAGETYVIYGGPSLPAAIDVNTTAPDLTVYGDDAGDRSGASVAAGDIDSDGTGDLIIGAFAADGPGLGACSDGGGGGRCDAGETYVVEGGPSLPAVIDLNTTSPDLKVYGDDVDDRAAGLAAGDINGDATDDLVIGAPAADPTGGDQAGESHVIYGSPSLPAIIDLSTSSADLAVYGNDPLDRAIGLAAGDIDGDGTDDLLISAFGGDGPGSGTSCAGSGLEIGDRCDAGDVYVVYGGASLPASVNLDTTSAGLTVYGANRRDGLGSGLAAGDINGDLVGRSGCRRKGWRRRRQRFELRRGPGR